DKRAHIYGCLEKSKCFAVNLLTASQQALSQRFAKHGPKEFADLAVTTSVTGVPILADALGFVECRLVDILAGGDHQVFIGEILAGDVRDGQPLIVYDGRY